MAKVGAPRKLTPERRERVVTAILAGAPMDVAARRGGISPGTHYDWQARGRAALELAEDDLDSVVDDHRLFAEYSEAVENARLEWELRQLALITRGAQGVPVERRDPRTGQMVPTDPIETKTVTKTYADGTVETTVTEKRGLEGNTADAKWLLERRNPQVYGKVWRAEVTGPDGAPLEVSLDQTVARLDEMVDELAARRERRTTGTDG